MEDARFRRSVIVQYLILFQYLSGFSQEEKERTAALLAARGTTKQSLVQPNYVLSDEQVQWIDETREILVGLLRSIKPHGNLYTDIILTILAHERHWVIEKERELRKILFYIKYLKIDNLESIRLPFI